MSANVSTTIWFLSRMISGGLTLAFLYGTEIVKIVFKLTGKAYPIKKTMTIIPTPTSTTIGRFSLIRRRLFAWTTHLRD